MLKSFFLFVFLFVVFPASLYGRQDMEWAFSMIPDDCYMVAELSNKVYISPLIDKYLKRVLPSVYSGYKKQVNYLKYTSSIVVVLRKRNDETPIFFVGLSSYNREIVREFSNELSEGEIMKLVKNRGFIRGRKEQVKNLLSAKNRGKFLSLTKG